MMIVFWGLWLYPLCALAFDSYEHIATGTNGVQLHFPDDKQIFDDFPYKAFYDLILLPEHKPKIGKIEYTPQYILVRSGNEVLKLSYGEIIAIAGDFAGLLKETISNSISLKDFEKMRPELEERFKGAFNALLPYKNNPFYANNNLEYLRELFKNEYKSLILKLAKEGSVHFNNASSHSVTSKIKDQWAYAKSPGYVDLLSINVDHFEEDAKVSYAIGHTIALEEAKKAYALKAKGEQDEAVATLNMAYAMDAFASHFLTDLFSSGHLRTPRGPLLDISKIVKYRLMGYTATNVGLMANAGHDEDNYSGLWVKNIHQVWNAFGDGSYFDVKSEDNRFAIREALQASIDEVSKAFETGELTRFKSFNALKLVGEPLPSGSDVINQLANPFPLFRMGTKWPQVRKSYYDNFLGEYQDITVATGATSFIKNDVGTFNRDNVFSFLNDAHLVYSLKRDIKVECYNTFDRESIWPSKSEDYTVLKDLLPVIAIDNSSLGFHKKILKGNLRENGEFYTVNQEMGQKIIDQCKHALETSAKLGEVNSSVLVEIRGRIDRGYSHPLAYYNEKGEIVRLFGYKSDNKSEI